MIRRKRAAVILYKLVPLLILHVPTLPLGNLLYRSTCVNSLFYPDAVFLQVAVRSPPPGGDLFSVRLECSEQYKSAWVIMTGSPSPRRNALSVWMSFRINQHSAVVGGVAVPQFQYSQSEQVPYLIVPPYAYDDHTAQRVFTPYAGYGRVCVATITLHN
jgi:hypothetical protein